MNEEAQRLWGFYTAFDRKVMPDRNRFSQVMFGGEFWKDHYFIGANWYHPIGIKSRPLSFLSKTTTFNYAKASKTIYGNYQFQQVLRGGDLRLGYELREGLIGYLGGYHFMGPDVRSMTGVEFRLDYQYARSQGKILGILDEVGVEFRLAYDRRGTNGALGIKFRVGVSGSEVTKPQGFAKHMVELVRRDCDIVSDRVVSNVESALPPLTITVEDFPAIAQEFAETYNVTYDDSTNLSMDDLVRIQALLIWHTRNKAVGLY